LLGRAGFDVNADTLKRFQHNENFYTYPGELQPSLTTTAHAVLALAFKGMDVATPRKFLISKQTRDGRWSHDKWHASWLYATSQVITALAGDQGSDVPDSALDALLQYQHEDGGWGIKRRATAAETSYAVIAVHALRHIGHRKVEMERSLRRAAQWLLSNYRPFGLSADNLWIGKELYCPHRIEKIFELSAILAGIEESRTTRSE
jgi:squalene cyclase